MLFGEQVNANWSLVGCNFWMPNVVGHNARLNHVSAFAWALCWFWTWLRLLFCGFAFMEIPFCASCSSSHHVSGNGQDHGLFCKPICPSLGSVLSARCSVLRTRYSLLFHWLQLPCHEIVFLWNRIFACGARFGESQPASMVRFVCHLLPFKSPHTRTSGSWEKAKGTPQPTATIFGRTNTLAKNKSNIA